MCYHGKGSPLNNQQNKDFKCQLLWVLWDWLIRSTPFTLMHKLQLSVEAGDVLLEEKNSEVLVESFQRMVSQAKTTTCVACVLQMIICPAFMILQPWPWLRNTMSLLEKPLSLEVQRLSLSKMVAGKNLADCKSIRTVDSLLLWQAAQTKVPTESCQQDQGVHYEKAVAVSALVAPSWLMSLVDGS